jgi:hypothetical protein
MKLSSDQIKKLKEPLPAEAVKPHPTKNYLSSIKAIYVVERLNDVFGVGAWHLRSEIVNDRTDMIVVKAVLTVPEYEIELESYGGNNNGGEGSKNFDLGDAYKGATTDALTKICSYLGIGMDVFKGLATPDSKPPAQINGVPLTQPAITGKDLPWLNENTKEFTGAVEKLRAGTTTLDGIRKVRRVSKAIETKLLEASKN